MALKFDQPLKIDFKGNPGIRTFVSVEDVESFVQDDLKAWNNFFSEVGRIQSPNQIYRNLINTHKNCIERNATAVSNYRILRNLDRDTYQNILNSYVSKTCIHAQSGIGQECMQLLGQGLLPEACGLIFAATGCDFNENEKFRFSTPWGNIPAHGILTGASIATSIEQGFSGSTRTTQAVREAIANSEDVVADTRSALSKFDTDTTAVLEKAETDRQNYIDQFSHDLEDAKAQFAAMVAEHKSRMSAIEASFSEDMKLRKPRDYWEKKETGHKTSGDWWTLWLFIWAALIAAAFVGAACYLLNPDHHVITSSTSPATWLLIFGPVIVVLWLLRFINKQATTHLALRQDARERVTLIETYLALYSENKVREDQLSLVLQSIFRPSNVTGDEGMQAGLWERIIEVLSKK